MPDVLARIEAGSGQMVAATIRTIFAQPDAAGVAPHLLADQFPTVQDMLRAAETDITAYATLPSAHSTKRCPGLSQPCCSGAFCRSDTGRTPRRMAGRRPPLPVRVLHGRAARHRNHGRVHRPDGTATKQEDHLNKDQLHHAKGHHPGVKRAEGCPHSGTCTLLQANSKAQAR